MSQIVEALMRRDRMTKAKAIAKLKEVLQMVSDCGYDTEELDVFLNVEAYMFPRIRKGKTRKEHHRLKKSNRISMPCWTH